MNCLNTMGSGICVKNNDVVTATITGGTYNLETTNNLYTYTFAASGNRTIQFDRNILSMNVIVVGGGGPGGGGNNTGGSSGGAGGGFGYWNFNYTRGVTYNITVGASSGQGQTGNNSSFLSSSIGVTATGGGYGNQTVNRPLSGSFTKTGAASGTITQRTGGNGGLIVWNSGIMLDDGDGGEITVLGIHYNYGGGGKAGSDTENRSGGNPGVDGVGGTTTIRANNGGSATTPGSGGGGGSNAGTPSSAYGGRGGSGLVIITFNYP